MKAFISCRITGEDVTQLEPFLVTVMTALSKIGIEPYSSFFQMEFDLQRRATRRDKLDRAFEKIAERDLLVVLLTSDELSEGLLMEIGCARAYKIPILMFQHKDVRNDTIAAAVTVRHRYADIDDLVCIITRENDLGITITSDL